MQEASTSNRENMNSRVQIDELVIDAVKSLAHDHDIDELASPSLDTRVYSNLNSFAVLDLILDLERRIQNQMGHYIQIADENTFDPTLTPFQTVSHIADYLMRKIVGAVG